MRWAFVLCSLMSLCAFAAEGGTTPPARSLDELLDQVSRERMREEAHLRERENRFIAERDKQLQRIQQVRRELGEARATAATLNNEYEAGEQRMAALQTRLDQLAGSLGELQAGVRQFAADMRPLLSESMLNLHHPGRLGELDQLLEPQRLINAADIEALWLMLLREMTESGKSAHMMVPVADAAGNRDMRAVVRVGSFTAIDAEGHFLHYLPGQGGFDQPSRQPDADLRDVAAAFFSDTDQSMRPMVVDPTRGELLMLLSQVPTLPERIRQGGLIGYLIIAMGGFALVVAGLRFVQLAGTERRVERQLSDPQPRDDNPLGRVLSVHDSARDADVETLRLKLDEAVLRELPRVERGLPMLALIAAMTPMLGLLGTVTGMIRTFQAITLFGAGDPRLMSGGISEALVTTVLGLVTAIPLLLAHSALAGRSERLVHVLDQQSAGLLARRIEQGSGGHESI